MYVDVDMNTFNSFMYFPSSFLSCPALMFVFSSRQTILWQQESNEGDSSSIMMMSGRSGRRPTVRERSASLSAADL